MAARGLGDGNIVDVLGARPEQLLRDGGGVGVVARRQEFRTIASYLLKMRDLELIHILAAPDEVEVVPILPTRFSRERLIIYLSDPHEIIGSGDLRHRQISVLSERCALLLRQNQGTRRCAIGPGSSRHTNVHGNIPIHCFILRSQLGVRAVRANRDCNKRYTQLAGTARGSGAPLLQPRSAPNDGRAMRRGCLSRSSEGYRLVCATTPP